MILYNMLIRTCSTILTMPKKDNGLEGSRLEINASEWLFYQIVCILTDPKEEIDDMLAGKVLESIHMY
jgi:hypothetical protein